MNREDERSKTPSTEAWERETGSGAAAPPSASVGAKASRAPGGASSPKSAIMARLVCAVLPAILAATGVGGATSAAHDDGIVRTAGAGFTGAFRALDLLVAAPTMLLPIGGRGMRAGLASAVVTAVCGAVAFDLAYALGAAVIPSALDRVGLRSRKSVSSGLVAAVAAAAVLTALLSPPWQTEASAPGGSVTGALLVLLSLRMSVRLAPDGRAAVSSRIAPLMFVLGLAASYEPLVFVAALAGAAPAIVAALRAKQAKKAPELESSGFVHGAFAFGLGALPFGIGLALLRRVPEIAFDVPVAAWIERGIRDASLQPFLADLGTFALVVCGGGAVIALVASAAKERVIAIGLALVVGVGVVALFLRMPFGPARFAAPVLAGLLAAHVLGTALLGGFVLAIARARVPFAEASAALLVVLELVLPVKAIDETTTRRDGRVPHAAAIWNDIAWGAAPPASVILVADRATMQRVASARAVGAMRGDLIVVPSYDVQGRTARRALAGEPKLAPLYRDVALGIPPEELSLATLSAQRPVLATFDPRWERSLARHLIPIGLTSRFEPEPRGSSDRKQALDAFLPLRDRLVRVAVAKKDAELAAATAVLLRARAVGMAATGEREMLSRALDDLRAFAPDDAVGAMLVRRTLTTKGAIDVHDLVVADRR